jgi:hypothetical protein
MSGQRADRHDGRPSAAGARDRAWFPSRHLAELVAVFAVGFALMHFLYSGTGGSSGVRGNLPGNDCFYHVKMAALLPEIGLPRTFPWLTTTIFSERFVSHHYGFHVLLSPFVLISKSLTGDYIPGAKVFMSITFGLMLAVGMLILIDERVRARWLWLSLMLVLPADFYVRHAYVRAIDLSLLLQLVGMLLIFRRRYVWAGVVVAAYTHVYLGSFFLVIIAVIHFVGGLVDREGPKPDWRLAGWIAAGSVVGLITHPYFLGSISFLKTQIFASGLTPEVPVGREWNPYENAWSFAMLAGVPLVTQGVSLAARLRIGPRLSRNEWTMLVASLFFFGLTLKARRFIEYWPMYAILSSAMLAGGVLGRGRLRDSNHPTPARDGIASAVLLIALLACGLYSSVALYVRRGQLADLLAWWPIWCLLAATYGFAIAVGARRSSAASASRMHRWRGRAVGVAALFAIVTSLTVVGGALQLVVRRWAKGKYDLNVIEPAMAALAEHSQPGDVVFTDDWDVFPVYFFFNSKNHYIVGLDPAFSHRRDPELWQRYVKISRGQTPATAIVKDARDGKMEDRSIEVKLTDIRDRFAARFVVVDDDHAALRKRLDAAPEFAKRIYPEPTTEHESKPPPLVVYEVLDTSGGVP